MAKRRLLKTLADFEARHGGRTTKEFQIKDVPDKKHREFFDIRTGTTYVVDLEQD